MFLETVKFFKLALKAFIECLNFLDGNCHHFDAPLKHAVKLGVFCGMRIFASCFDQAGPFMEKYNS